MNLVPTTNSRLDPFTDLLSTIGKQTRDIITAVKAPAPAPTPSGTPIPAPAVRPAFGLTGGVLAVVLIGGVLIFTMRK